MENDKPNINEELNHIKNTINKKNKTLNNDESFVVLDNIVLKGKKTDIKIKNYNQLKNKDVVEKKNNISTKEIIKTIKQSKNSKKNIYNKNSNSGKNTKDPVSALVDREIKPIIKKWIGKNLKSFVKSIVIQEMKLISKATQKNK